MTLKALQWVVRGGVLLSAAGVIFFILTVNPDEARPGAIGAFFLLIFTLITSAIVLLLLGVFRKGLGEARTSANIPTIIRLAALFAGLVSALLLLRFFGWLTWWAAALLVAGTLLVELTLRRVIR